MRKLMAIAAVALVVVVVPALGKASQDLPFGWLAGDWREDKEGRWTTEHWEIGPEGSMAGIGSSGEGSAVAESEGMVIMTDPKGAVFIATPKGAQAPTSFRQIARGAQNVTFENAAHDYPQRIRYWREGDALLAEISMKDGSRAMLWRYTRVK